MAGSNIEDVIAGTNIKKNPELPAPKIVKTEGMESGIIEVPLSDDRPIPSATLALPKIKIKKEISIREADNGYIMNVRAGMFNEEWVFGKLKNAIKAMMAFLNTEMEE